MNEPMKYFGRFFTAIALSLLLNACLDEHPKGLMEEDKAYTSATTLYLNTVGNLYLQIGGHADSQGLQGTYRGVYDYNTFTTDEAMLPIRGGDWYDGGYWQNLYLHQWTETDLPLLNTWNYLYKSVGLCNHALKEIDRHKQLLTDLQYKEFTAEARGLRALFYFYIMDMWGNVPLIMQENVSLKDVKQSARKDVTTTLIAELQAAIPYLSDAHSNHEGNYYGRFTRPVAYFLLAKILLNHEVYLGDKTLKFTIDGHQLNALQACIACCDKITEAGYTLESNYAANFIVHNENSKENIFTIPMDKIRYENKFLNLFRSRHYSHGGAIGMSAENGSCATLSTLSTYKYGTPQVDKRYAINFFSDTLRVDGKVVYLSNGEPLVYRPLEVALSLTGSKYEKTAGARMAKYEIDRTAHDDGRLQDNDIVLFRYADVLLMKAEAQLRSGHDGSIAMNLVRNRAGMASLPATLSNLLDERLLEFMWEGWRRNDLIRFGLFHKAYDVRRPIEGENTRFTCLFPIPKGVLQRNTNLKQNPGYK